jgi:hypothetical protein
LLDSPQTDDRILKKKFKTCINEKGNEPPKGSELPFIKGRFSTIEVDSIDKALEEYLKEKNLGREAISELIHSKKSKQKIKGFFRDILERSHVNRSVDQLYFYMARKYSEIPAQNEPWSQEEDVKLLKLVEFKGRKWKEISLELNRKDVKVRYEKISRKSSGFHSSWSQEETEKFMQGKKFLEEKYNLLPIEFNHWTELSLLVGTKSFMQCRTKYIHSTYNNVNGYKVKWTLEDDTILLKRLREDCSQAQDESEIIWNRIASNEWVPWTGACLQRRWHKLKTRCSLSFNSFIDQLNYISANLRLLSRTKYMNRDLLTFYSNQNNGIWNLEESREFLSHILTLFSDATCEDEVDWGSLRFSSWDGPFLRKKWAQIKQQLKPRESLGFIGNIKFNNSSKARVIIPRAKRELL